MYKLVKFQSRMIGVATIKQNLYRGIDGVVNQCNAIVRREKQQGGLLYKDQAREDSDRVKHCKRVFPSGSHQ